jgi:hypothetical protein
MLARLLCAEDFSNVRACEKPGCTLIFADHTRGNVRRPCGVAGFARVTVSTSPCSPRYKTRYRTSQRRMQSSRAQGSHRIAPWWPSVTPETISRSNSRSAGSGRCQVPTKFASLNTCASVPRSAAFEPRPAYARYRLRYRRKNSGMRFKDPNAACISPSWP